MNPISHLRRTSLPPPDPSTRVEVDFVPEILTSTRVESRRRGELIVAAGLGGILVSVCSAFAKFLDLPSLSEKTVAGIGVVLVLVGGYKAHAARAARPVLVGEVEQGPSISVDLPSLTGALSGTLAQLRQEHGMAYRTRTWIEEILPMYGQPLTDPALARDLLAAAALDAGGIRADLGGIADAHSRDAIVVTGTALLEALQGALSSCEGSTAPPPRPSDPSSWPASTWVTATIAD